jgi:hypothetical protein
VAAITNMSMVAKRRDMVIMNETEVKPVAEIGRPQNIETLLVHLKGFVEGRYAS